MNTRLKLFFLVVIISVIFFSTLKSEKYLMNPNIYSPVSDSLELVDFYNSLNGLGWDDAWDLNSPVSTWPGVILNDNGCVKELSLIANNLVGSLIDLNLPFLEKMILTDNKIFGVIPDFSYLINLKILNLNKNSFNTNIPDFSNLPELEVLHLSECELVGGIPDFSNMTNLWQFIASENNLEGSIPNFSNLLSLEYLQLSNNALSGVIPDFSNTPLLSVLNLSNNQLLGPVPNFSNLNLLSSLALSENQLTGFVPDLNAMPSLTVINLDGNQLTGEIPDFTNLPELVQLNLSSNQLSGPIPDFSNLQNLKNLFLTDNNISSILPDFSNLSSLQVLYIDNNQLDTIPTFTNLSAIIYVGNNKLTFDDILPNLPLSNNNSYWPQDSIYETQTIVVTEGENLEIELGIDAQILTNSYQWYKNNNLYNAPLNQNKIVFENIQLDDAGVYRCQVTNSNTFLLTLYSRLVTIIVEENPLKILLNSIEINNCPFDNGGIIDIEICGGTPPYNYHWNSGATTEDIQGLANGQYVVTVTDSNNIAIVDTFLLIPNTVFPSAYAGEDELICGEDLTFLSASFSNDITGQWSTLSSSAIIESSNINTTSVYNLTPGINLFVWTISTNDCLAFDRDTVSITYMPMPNAVSDVFEIPLESHEFKFNVLENDLYFFEEYNFEILDYLDQELNYLSAGNFSYQASDIPLLEKEISFQYELCNSSCINLCDTATVALSFFKEGLEIPNTITPNEDGINDSFQFPASIYNSGNNNGIIIFNRWGDIVYKAKPYLNDWSGESLKGNILPSGTYYFRFISKLNNVKIYSGDITILR